MLRLADRGLSEGGRGSLWRCDSTMGVRAAAASSVILQSRELRCVSFQDSVLGEGGRAARVVASAVAAVRLHHGSQCCCGVLRHSSEPRASVRVLPDPVQREWGAGSEGGGVCCGGVVPPWESVLLRRHSSFFGAASFGACPSLTLF
jgi:hypothetical protein